MSEEPMRDRRPGIFRRLISYLVIVSICSTLAGGLTAAAGRVLSSAHPNATPRVSSARLGDIASHLGSRSGYRTTLTKAERNLNKYMPALRPRVAARATSSGMSDASVLITPAPAGYRQTLENYLASAGAALQQSPSLTAFAKLSTQLNVAQKLVAAASDQDLAQLHWAMSQLPDQTQTLSTMIKASRWYSSAHHFAAAHAHSLLSHDFAGNCPARNDTIGVVLGLEAAWGIALIFYQIWASSITPVAGGEGFTLPFSPVRIIVSIAVTITFAAYSGAHDAYQISEDCVESAHRDQLFGLNQYINNDTSNMQVDVRVTPIDAYHFLIATHENGQPININPATVQLETYQGTAGVNGQNPLPLIVNGASMCGSPPTQYQCGTGAALSNPIAGTDPGVYELTIPTSMVGTSYRLVVDDGAGAPNNHYGMAVFTKGTNF